MATTIDPFDLVSRDEVLEHLRIDEITPLVERYGQQALAYCLAYLDKDITQADEVPAQAVSAMLMVWADLHSHRTAQREQDLYLNQAVINLLDQVRSYRDLPLSEYDT